MAGSEVYMNVDSVRQFAKQYGQMGELLIAQAGVMDALAAMLMAEAFMGNIGAATQAFQLEMAKPMVLQMSQACQQMGQDLDQSATAYENGDQQGATRFY